jgi:RHS repeat-associated protein
MTTAVSMGAIAQRALMKRSRASSTARRVAAAGVVVCVGAVLTVADSPPTRSSEVAAIPSPASAAVPPALQGSTPAAEATDVSGRMPLVVRFSRPMAAASLSAHSVTLVGPTGAEPIRVLPLGTLAIVQPVQELLPASRYTLFINGATDEARRPLPLSTIGFDTAAKSDEVAGAEAAPAAAQIAEPGQQPAGGTALPTTEPSDRSTDASVPLAPLGSVERLAIAQTDATADSGDWVPGPQHFKGRWLADRTPSPMQTLPPLQAPAGATALTGQVLGMNGRPVRDVTLRIGGREARTDVTGRFLLQGLSPGFAKMEIDGVTANRGDAYYGYYAARIEIKPRQTTVVPYTIWMPRLDPAGTVRIAAPTTTETVVTSPRIPGLELHIPAGTVIRDRQGNIVTELNLTAIPIDRPPFPVPSLDVPVYFTIQPGGAVMQSVTGKPSPGARLFYPNFKDEVPGARGAFWNYDPEDREWFIYGQGTISADARQAIPDDGVVIHELTGAMFNGSNVPGPDGPPVCVAGNGDGIDVVCGYGGDPVSLFTGQFDHTEHDAFLSDVIPIDITRTYSSLDVNRRAFGIGMTHAYDVFLFSQNQWQEVDVILPSGTRVHFVRTSPGTDANSAEFKSSAPGRWRNAVILRNLPRGGWDLIFRNGGRWFFPQFQPLTEISDRNGNVVRIVREGNNGTSGKVVQVVSPHGRSASFTYNAAGLVSAISDNIDRTYTYSYDDAGHLTAVVDPLGGTRSFTWNLARNRLAAIHAPNGTLVVQNEYASGGRVLQQDLGDGSSYSYDYTRSVCPPDPPPPGCVPTVIQTDLTDRRGTVRSVRFDPQGNVVQRTEAAGLPEEQVFHYEITNGLLSASIDSLNRRTEYGHDAQGNLTRITRLAGTGQAVSTTMTYGPVFTLPQTVTDANGNTATMTYDSRGNLTRIADPLGHAATFSFDEQGRPLTITDPLGRVTTLRYDGPDLASMTDPLGRQSEAFTDTVGRIIATVDPLGNRSAYGWDDLNRLVSFTDPLGGVTSFSYDGNDNLLSASDAKGNTNHYAYDAQNKIQSIQDALLNSETRFYEPGGQPSASVDRMGQLSAVSYDALGRPTTMSFGATEVNPTAYKSQIECTWDAANRLTQIVDKTCDNPIGSPNCTSVASASTVTRSYDELDRIVSEVTPQGEVDYGYDSAGRRISMTIRNGAPGAQITQPTITYSYDNANRLTGIHQAAGAINAGAARNIALAYDAADQRTQTTLANGSTVNHTYDGAGQLTAIVYRKADGSQIGDLLYEYDAAGRRISIAGSLAQQNLPTTDITDAAYDANNRLLTWAGQTYAYDDNGNMLSDGTSAYAWDERNQLRSIRRGPNEIASFQYDAQGRRTGKTIGSVTTGFLYDGLDVVQELQGTSRTAPVTAHLLTGGLDEVFLRLDGNDGANQHSVLGDFHGAIMLLNATQSKVVGYAYEPYGATTADAAHANTRQYTGRENDNPGNDHGLYFYRARYYMPGIARFISEDPIGWASGQTNNYGYVGGDPVNFTDPLGLDAYQNIEDFFAGFGDGLTFGLTSWMRDVLGINGVNPNSGWYLGGEITAAVAMVAVGGTAGAARAGGRAPLGLCFAAGTLVHTERGLVPIEEVRVGDRVWSRSDETGEQSYRPVVRTFVTPDQPTLELHFASDGRATERVDATVEHPFWVVDRGWVAAGDLRPGDEVSTSHGGRARVLSATSTERTTTVYNFEVEQFHTYFVGEAGLWVHNSCSFTRILQTGGNKIASGTAKALNEVAGRNLSPREWGRALEALKKELGFANNHHGKITSTGDYLDEAGKFIGNLLDYLP